MERRELRLSQLQVRTSTDGPSKLEGYAAVFNELSEDLGGFRERILPGAFATNLEDDSDILALADHDHTKVIGRRSIGTLDLAEDDHGLFVSITPPDTSVGRDVVELVKTNHIDSMSFGFFIRDSEWTQEEGEDVSILKDIDVREVSAVTYPAYSSTEIAVRVAPERIQQLKNIQAKRTIWQPSLDMLMRFQRQKERMLA